MTHILFELLDTHIIAFCWICLTFLQIDKMQSIPKAPKAWTIYIEREGWYLDPLKEVVCVIEPQWNELVPITAPCINYKWNRSIPAVMLITIIMKSIGTPRYNCYIRSVQELVQIHTNALVPVSNQIQRRLIIPVHTINAFLKLGESLATLRQFFWSREKSV